MTFSNTEVKLRLFAGDACFSCQLSVPGFVNSIVNKEQSKIYKWLRANRTLKKCDFSVMVNSFVIEHQIEALDKFVFVIFIYLVFFTLNKTKLFQFIFILLDNYFKKCFGIFDMKSYNIIILQQG